MSLPEVERSDMDLPDGHAFDQPKARTREVTLERFHTNVTKPSSTLGPFALTGLQNARGYPT